MAPAVVVWHRVGVELLHGHIIQLSWSIRGETLPFCCLSMLLIAHSLVQSHRRNTVLWWRVPLLKLDIVTARNSFYPMINQSLKHPIQPKSNNLPENWRGKVLKCVTYKICLQQRHVVCCVSEVKQKYISDRKNKKEKTDTRWQPCVGRAV